MAASGVHWVDQLFNAGVYVLVYLAHTLGMSYEAVNVWVFIIMLPAVLLASLALNVQLLLNRKQQKWQS
jgi:hypothetical protein